MGHFATLLKKLNNDEALDVGTYAIEKIAARNISFEEEDSSLKMQVAEIMAAK